MTYWNSGESDNSKKFEISERNENSGSDFQKVCVEEMQKGNVNGALKLLTDNMDHRILPLNDDTISKPKMKHPQASAPDPIILLPDEAQNIHPIRYEDITAEKVEKLRLILIALTSVEPLHPLQQNCVWKSLMHPLWKPC